MIVPVKGCLVGVRKGAGREWIRGCCVYGMNSGSSINPSAHGCPRNMHMNVMSRLVACAVCVDLMHAPR